MALCQTCKTFILWGGVKIDGRKYCNSKCMEQDSISRAADRIPDSVVRKEAENIRKSPCPECNQITNDIDMRFTYRAVSYLVMTTWSKNPVISCRDCYHKKNRADTAATFLLGWWGFPFGLIVTPIQLLRNIKASGLSSSAPAEPSPDLCSFARNILAQTMIENPSQQISTGKGLGPTKKNGALRRNASPPISKRVVDPEAKPIEPS